MRTTGSLSEAQQSSPRLVDDLVYDVGMHLGEDTAYYLAKGYRVVAFEANPDLVRECSSRFAADIARGALTIVEGAIADASEKEVSFYIDRESVWGSIDPAWVEKKNVHRAQRRISVPVVDLASCMRGSGVPHYLKIDIEGADRICLEALRGFAERPRFVSLEAGPGFDEIVTNLDLLVDLGYSRFKAVQQADIPGREISTRTLSGEPLSYRFPPRSSGPFGDDTWGRRWCSRDATVGRYRRIFWRYRLRGALAENRLTRKLLMRPYLRYAWFHNALGGHHDTHASR